MAFDYKKEYKEYYMPKAKPEIIEIPPMNYIAVRGVGDPNEEGGAYKAGHRAALRHRVHAEDEQKRLAPDRRIF